MEVHNDDNDELPPQLEEALAAAERLPSEERRLRFAQLAAEFPAHAAEIELLAEMVELKPPVAPVVAAPVAGSMDVPEAIGPYRLLERLGEGGMGVVFLAEQTEPIRRRVALKLIRLGMDSESVVRRFEQERQALAVMDHEGIARVFDCGVSARGQPFFVMELVQGAPLDRYCEDNRLRLEERLGLMRDVCAAVQHAHQKGVVHRDLKPSNILVTENAGRTQIKVIDFGLAKAMGERLIEATLHTQAGAFVGTPEYMAPEQADPGNLDIDTRADVYSLGVILYDLLVGELPFSTTELRGAGLLEVQRILREVEPPKPSTKLTIMGDASTDLASRRRLSVSALKTALKSDLDWVVVKAIEKDRDRRYDSANALSEDLARFLQYEPLLAGPPSAAYRVRKLCRRYRGQLVAAVAVLVTAIGGVAVASSYAMSANALANEKGRLAARNSSLAQVRGELARRLEGQIRDFQQLAGIVKHARARRLVEQLVPAWPQQIGALRAWLEDHCEPLLAMRANIEQTIATLRSQALPWTEDERDRDRRRHPKYLQWSLTAKTVASWRRAEAIRSGRRPLEIPELDEATRGLTAHQLGFSAWQRVTPPPRLGEAGGRKVWGEEAKALAMVRLALRIAGDAVPASLHGTAAYAWQLNGQDELAREAMAAAVAAAEPARRARFEDDARRLADELARSREQLAEGERILAELGREVGVRATYSFPPEAEASAFLLETLVELHAALDQLATCEKVAVERRLAWAEQVEELTIAHPNATVTWESVRRDIVADSRFRYLTKRLRLLPEDVVGLVPMGKNPVTGLHEFYHLRSAWDGVADPAGLPIPTHGSDGSVAIDDTTGIVFTLLPGERLTVGPVIPGLPDSFHVVQLGAFLMARHEITKGQWERLWSGASPGRYPSFYAIGATRSNFDGPVSRSHPLENVDWQMSQRLLEEYGLTIPTELQWEFASRAGSLSPWHCSREELVKHANLADQSFQSVAGNSPCEPWSDGFAGPAPVGSFVPNAFGLYDMHGNVDEWTLDGAGPRGSEFGPSGLREDVANPGMRVVKGGSFQAMAPRARCGARGNVGAVARSHTLGVRAARWLRFRD